MEYIIAPICYEIKTPSHLYIAKYEHPSRGWLLFRDNGINEKILTFDGWFSTKTNYSIAQVFPVIEDVKEYIERL